MVIRFTTGPIIASSSFPHETQIKAFLEMNRRPGKIESSFLRWERGASLEIVSDRWDTWSKTVWPGLQPSWIRQTVCCLCLSLERANISLSALLTQYSFVQLITFQHNTSLFICAACSDFYLMSVRLSKTLHSLVKCWPWDVFPGALWCFKEHFYLAGKGLVTKHNCTCTPWISVFVLRVFECLKYFIYLAFVKYFFVDLLFVCLF